jgi:K+-sensing histidine kinase KdpD
MIRSIVGLMEPHARDIRVALKVECEPALPSIVDIDEDKIAWTLGTLIGNALRHAGKGSFFHPGGEIVVHAGPGPGPGQIAIDVIDDGPGIPADKLRLLFEPAPYQRRVGTAPARGWCFRHNARRCRMTAASSFGPLRSSTPPRTPAASVSPTSPSLRFAAR